MKVLLRNPRRELEMPGPVTVIRLLEKLELNRESHLVIRNGTLIPGDEQIADEDTVEIRPVISGGLA
jgi:sulfur carrier protein